MQVKYDYSVLIIEDDAVVSLLLDKISKNLVKTTYIAQDGLLGLDAYKKYFQEHKKYIDVVVTDIVMPIVDGFELISEIREINPNQEILVMSAYNTSEFLEKLMSLGVKNFIHKPLVKEEFITILSNTLENIKNKSLQVEQNTRIYELNQELDNIIETFDNYVVTLRTDKNGIITDVSKAYEDLCFYKKSDLLGKSPNILRHPDMPSAIFKELWRTITKGATWKGEIKNLRADGSFYWTDTTITPNYDINGKHIGYSAFAIDITNKKHTEILHKHLNTYINNIEQGFLTVDLHTLRVDPNFSKKCVEILHSDDIYGHLLSHVLFDNDSELQELFEYAIDEYQKTDDALSKELFISLLPDENTINGVTFKIQYKQILEENKLFVILTDVTSEKILEKKIKEEEKVQKMIISVATHKEETIKLKNAFNDFLNNLYDSLTITTTKESDYLKLKRSLHTFKGQFLQKEMHRTSEAIHEMESELSSESANVLNTYKLVRYIKNKLQKALSDDLQHIAEILGDEFLSGKTYLHISNDRVENLETQMLDLLYNIKTNNKKPLYSLLDNISNLRHSSLVDLLGDYPHSVKTISTKLGKKIYPFKIEGDSNIFVEPSIKSFIETLVHVFRNAVDHGIEDVQERHLKGKDIIGRVTCNVDKKGDMIFITISDDGKGIDTEKTLKKAIKQGKISPEKAKEIDEDAILKLVFTDGFTTKDDITEISGRGIGLNTVFYELEKIKGEVKIKNTLDHGVSFIFSIPNTLEIKENSLITQSEENFILNSVVNASLDFLENNMDISIVSKYTNQELLLEKHFSTIKYMYSNEVFCIISMTTEVLNKVCYTFLGGEELPAQEYEMVVSSLPAEVANIVCGLSITKFQELDEDLKMSEPILFDKKIIANLAKNNNAISNVIETIYGNFVCTIINISKE